MSRAGATGFEPAVFGLTGRHVNHYTTPPVRGTLYHNPCGPSNPRGTFAMWAIPARDGGEWTVVAGDVG